MLAPLSRLVCGSTLGPARRTLTCTAPLAAARKGTRERKKAKLVKKEEVKTEWVPKSVLRAQQLNLQPRANRRFDRSRLPEAIDDVYMRNWFRWPEHQLKAAVAMHRETHHPTVYNRPDELVWLTAELDLQMDKRTRFADAVRRVLVLPHEFEYAEPREVAVFCQSAAQRELVTSLGVTVVGGGELIKQFQSGALMADDFAYFVAHPDMMEPLAVIRGLLRSRRYPSFANGSVATDLAAAVGRFRSGLEYSSEKDEFQQDFAQVTAPFGRLSMPDTQLAENFATLLNDMAAARPRGHNRQFVTRVSTWCQPKTEVLDIDFQPILLAAVN